jgi:uncharacterized protein
MSGGLLKVFFDTSTLVAVCLYPDREPAKIFQQAMLRFELVATHQTLTELAQVLSRPKFDAWRPLQTRMTWYRHCAANMVQYSAIELATECRDAKDNKFLDAALASKAGAIVSSDQDLRVLHPYRDVDVLNLQDFQRRYLTDQLGSRSVETQVQPGD